jgi:GNAT superfamily N-acetyltransferase
MHGCVRPPRPMPRVRQETSDDLDDRSWRLVADDETLRDARTVYREVWGGPERTPEQWQTDLAEARQPVAERPMFQVVAYVDGKPASAGGCTRAGDVARLWGAATRPTLRGRGAYRATVSARLRLAQEQGATLGLVKGLVDTSGPILSRLGFTTYGEERKLTLDLPS